MEEMPKPPGWVYKMNIVDGIPFPPFVTQQHMDKLKKFQLRSDDIILATYPKSGTTWMQQILKLIYTGGNENGKNVSEAVPWLERGTVNMATSDPKAAVDFDNIPSPRLLSSHAPYFLVPGGLPHTSPAKYIYVARNPKDVAVSFYYHSRAFKAYEYSGPWEHFYTLFVTGQVEFGSWFDHVLGWWEHRDQENILFLKYEDMQSDLHTSVQRIASFCGKNDLSPEVIERVVRLSTFQSMKANSLANGDWHSPFRNTEIAPFIRKGIIGDWKNHFSPKQNEEFDAMYLDKMKGSGLEFSFQ